MVDLGCHAAHGKYRNVSDALLWLHHFRSQNGGIVLGVDIIEDYSLDLQHRFDDVEPYRSMRGVSKRALTLAIGARDGVLEDHGVHVLPREVVPWAVERPRGGLGRRPLL